MWYRVLLILVILSLVLVCAIGNRHFQPAIENLEVSIIDVNGRSLPYALVEFRSLAGDMKSFRRAPLPFIERIRKAGIYEVRVYMYDYNRRTRLTDDKPNILVFRGYFNLVRGLKRIQINLPNVSQKIEVTVAPEGTILPAATPDNPSVIYKSY